MGTIYYGGSATPIHIEDRALAHLKVVIATKLRRNESFTVSWQHPEDQPRGRSTLWLHPSIPLRFVFDDPEPAELSRAWIEELATSANSSAWIMLVADHFDTDRPGGPWSRAASTCTSDGVATRDGRGRAPRSRQAQGARPESRAPNQSPVEVVVILRGDLDARPFRSVALSR